MVQLIIAVLISCVFSARSSRDHSLVYIDPATTLEVYLTVDATRRWLAYDISSK